MKCPINEEEVTCSYATIHARLLEVARAENNYYHARIAIKRIQEPHYYHGRNCGSYTTVCSDDTTDCKCDMCGDVSLKTNATAYLLDVPPNVTDYSEMLCPLCYEKMVAEEDKRFYKEMETRDYDHFD